MTQFTDQVAIYCKGLDTIAIGCLGIECEHADGDEEHRCEPSFSSVQCDSCGSSLAGDRETAYGMWTEMNGELMTIEMDVCVDCVMYHANGDEPEDWHYQ